MASPRRAVRRLLQRARPRRGHVDAAPTSGALALRDEKILLTLAIQTQQLNERLTRLEDRVEAKQHDTYAPPDADDVLELRMHSARLAAELSRVSIELRAEINELAARQGTDASVAHAQGSGEAGAAPPADALIDLREDQPVTRQSPSRSSGWRPARVPRPPTGGA